MNAIFDVLFVIGLASCVTGAALISLPAVLLVAGALIACGALVASEVRRG